VTHTKQDLTTRWGRDLDPDHVLVEYPRPQLVRDSYLNLNGWWDYAFTPSDAPGPTTYDGQILVPFSPEAPLSGVGRQLQPDELLWYRRNVSLPADFLTGPGSRVLLHFGAVDQTCTVWVGGVEVGSNHGGYLPFTCDITEVVRRGGGAAELVLRVRDASNNRGPSSGKQRLARGGIWYTAQSGIWQTVWAESVPSRYVDRLTLTPFLEQQSLEVTVHAVDSGTGPSDEAGESDGAACPAVVRVLADGAEVGSAEVAPGQPTRIPLAAVREWTPQDPFLYDVEVTLGEDRVTSYAGMRSFGVGPDEDGTPRPLLNGRPYFHTGVLDQGYWPDGLMTAPSDEALIHDIATMKSLGFTMLRKHIKVEPLRWYAHCDRIGMLVWQDLVNGGARYRRAAVTWPGRWPVKLRDDRPRSYRLLGRADPAGREEFRVEMRRTVEHLRNVTSLAVWVPFNEGWGQFDANTVAEEMAALDPTRSVDHASGWHDQGGGDLCSRHVYERPFRAPRRRPGDSRVLVLSEYGGYDLAVEAHIWGEKPFGYRRFTSTKALGEAFLRLHEAELAPTVTQGLSAVVYTQLSDVEDEVNGLLTYDREVLKLPEELVRRALAALTLRPPGYG